MLQITVKAKSAMAQLRGLASQFPYASALAVNDIGLQVQAKEGEGIESRFTLRRREFVKKQGVKVLDGFATKRRPSITIGPDRKGDFLAKFEKGGEKRPVDGHSIAIPVHARRNKRDIITKGNRPKALLARSSAQTVDGTTGKVFIVRVGEHVVHAGKRLAAGVYQRVGGKRNPGLKLLYLLKQRTRVDARLELGPTAKRVVSQGWGAAFSRALDRAAATAGIRRR